MSPADEPEESGLDVPAGAQSSQGEPAAHCAQADPFWPPERQAQSDPYGSPDVGLGDRDLVDSREIGDEASREVELPRDDPPVKVLRAPNQPSEADIEAHHAAGHVPFRSWCPTCVAASAKDAPHSSGTVESKHDFPVFSSDYAFMGTKDSSEMVTLYLVKECG